MFHGMWILSAFYLLTIREASRMRVQHATLMHEPRVKENAHPLAHQLFEIPNK